MFDYAKQESFYNSLSKKTKNISLIFFLTMYEVAKEILPNESTFILLYALDVIQDLEEEERSYINM